MTDRHVLVLAGGLSHEREVSLRSGSRLAQALRAQGADVSLADADASLLSWLRAHRPDAAVIALHGGRGENGSVQAVLELAGVPYVGTDAAHCRLAWDKPTAKTLMAARGFPTPPWVTLSHDVFRDLGAADLVDAIADRMTFPLVVKPYQGGSALGVEVVEDRADLPAALVSSFAYNDVLLLEQHVQGTEIAVTVIDGEQEPRSLPAVEIAAPGRVFDYEARYTAGMTTYHTPARLDAQVTEAARSLALGAHDALGLRDVSRTDAIVDPDGTVWFLEANVSPGLTETSMLPMAVAADSLQLGALYGSLIERAMERSRLVAT